MSDLKFPFRPFSRFMFRAPSISYDQLQELLTNSDTFRSLINSTNHGKVKEAVYLASPDLIDEISRLSLDDTDQKCGIPYLKYVSRMATRSTPFGAFAGCGIGIISNETNIQLKNSDYWNSFSRVDTNVLYYLANNASEKGNHIHQSVFLNPTYHSKGNRANYLEIKSLYGKLLFSQSSFELDFFPLELEEIRTKKNLLYLEGQLIGLGSSEEIQVFINELISNDILLSDSLIEVNNGDYLNQLINKVKEENFRYWLLKTKKKLESLNKEKIGDRFSELTELLSDISEYTKIPQKGRLLQTDICITANQISIDHATIEAIKGGLTAINKLSSGPRNYWLQDFKRRFRDRYGDQEIDLMTALDIDSNLYREISASQFPEANILTGIQKSKPPESAGHFNKKDLLLMDLYQKAIDNKETVIEITDKILDTLPGSWDGFHDTMFCDFEIFSTFDEKKPFLLLHYLAGSSAANILTRFMHMEPGFESLVHEITDFEQQLHTGKILAEITHLPYPRVGNIISRKSVRQYEIPIYSNYAVDREHVIFLNDLTIKVDQNHQIILRSKLLNQEVIPRLTSAHNHSTETVPIYNFLCSLQNDNYRATLTFNWGPVLEGKTFLPRVVYKNVVLKPARWIIYRRDIIQAANPDEILLRYGLPVKFWISDGDNRLYIDSRQGMFKEVFIKEIQKKEQTLIQEFFEPDYSEISSPEGRHLNEIVVFFHKN